MTVTVIPTAPNVGFKPEMFGGPGTVNTTPLLDVVPAVTTTGPVVAPAGTTATIPPGPHPEVVAGTPLKVTVPGDVPKSPPVIVTIVPTGPKMGEMLNIEGTFVTEKLTGLLCTPATVTTILPVEAPLGTVAAI